MLSSWIFLRDNEWDFHRYRALTGSRLKFWTVPQGLKIHRTLTVLWNPELLLEAVWTVALWTQDPHRASSAKLGDAIYKV